MSPNVGDKLGDHGNPAPNNPVWQPYRGIVTYCIECITVLSFSRTLRIFLDLSISRLFWQVQEVSDRKCITSVLSVFSSIVRDFLELFYNLWRTVLVKNKIVLDPALRLQSFRTPKTQQLVSEVGLNANNKSDGGPVQTLLEKLTASMNANMGEMKSDLTASMNANMGEMKSELTGMNANMGEMKSNLTASMNANMGEMKSVDHQYRRSEYQAY
ncbi:hypothetical protein TNCV_2509531 [Trichonephila clavipes]|nr:hypothetical protein TNCV_2509531 [Trichonephila clavipes]